MTTTTEDLAEQLADLRDELELAREAASDAERLLAADAEGWDKIGTSGELISRDKLRLRSRLARLLAVADPLISRGVNLRIAYVWGQGVSITAHEDPDDNGQDIDALVQQFLEDNDTTFGSTQARESLERAFATNGNIFLALPTSPLTGRVRVRTIPFDEVEDIITNPEDVAEPWFYKRTWTTTEVTDNDPANRSTRTVTRTVFYPDITLAGITSRRRATTMDGHPIWWDQPVIHAHVNRPDGALFGVPDTWAAIDWALGYKTFLTDWAKLVKALSQFAFRATASGQRRATQTREKLSAVPAGDGVGGTVIQPEGSKFEAIGKSGATIDSESGKPLAAMVASALDVPVTMLLSDPGQTGARAVAETLDQPLALTIGMRRDVHGAMTRTILDYVVDQAIRAPQGRLRGSRAIDPVTGRERWTLAGDQDRSIDIDWPSLDDVDVKTMMDALQVAFDTRLLPPLTIVRMMLVVLGVDNPEAVLDELTDDDTGEFVPPGFPVGDAVAARALQQFRDGRDPAAPVGGGE